MIYAVLLQVSDLADGVVDSGFAHLFRIVARSEERRVGKECRL